MRLTNSIRAEIVNSVMADTKKVDYVAQACDAVKKRIVAAAPKVIRDAYKFDSSAFRHESMYRDGVHVNFPVLFDGARVIATDAEIAPLLEAHKSQERARSEAKKAVSQLLSACATTNAVIAVAPELGKYLPTDEPKKCLPVTTGLTDKLAAAGWPKGGRK